ncbi:MAG: LytR C-terminal domain-containing protein [Candidatus Kerfeldbacteria bacterium]|nr:LytR C-terminal domain-containing protein [Candidatus Kerfeldbacteria bacterium]
MVDQQVIAKQMISFNRSAWEQVKARLSGQTISTLQPAPVPIPEIPTNESATNTNTNQPVVTDSKPAQVQSESNQNSNVNLPAPEPVPSPVPPPPPDPRSLKLKLLNASGIKGRAAEVKTILEAKGFVTQSIGNATINNAPVTILQLKADKEAYSQLLKNALASTYPIARQETLPANSDVEAVVLVGRK